MTISVEEASGRLAEVLKELALGPITLTKENEPIAQIVPAVKLPLLKPRPSGTLKGTVLYMAPDFNDTPPDFTEYSS